MPPRLNYTLKIHFSPLEFEKLQALKSSGGTWLLSQGVELDDAILELSEGSAKLFYWYWGRKADGSRHKKRTSEIIRFPNGPSGSAWLLMMFEDWASQQAIEKFWPGEHNNG